MPGARVTDLGSVLKTISSSLTAVDLHGLTWIELSFAILLIAGASGLVLGLGLIERRRDFALLAAMGAKGRQLGSFLWTEGLIILVAGMVLGFATGFGIAKMLVKVLTGVFDPAPQSLAIPWVYLIVLVVAGCVSTVLAIVIAQRVSQSRAPGAANKIGRGGSGKHSATKKTMLAAGGPSRTLRRPSGWRVLPIRRAQMRQSMLLLLVVLASPVAAQDTTVTLWTREVVKSAKLNEERAIYVATPVRYSAETIRYPVLVILDADDKPQFNLALANVAFLASRDAIPRMIVVGITNGKDRTTT